MNKKELLIFSICVFMTIVAWMIADLAHAKKTTIIEDIVTDVHIPSYTIDSETLSILQEKTP